MFVASTLLFVACLLAFLIGLIKPGLVVRWGERRNRRAVFIYYGLATVVFFVISVASVDAPPKGEQVAQQTQMEKPGAPQTATKKIDPKVAEADKLWKSGKHQEAAIQYEKMLETDNLDQTTKAKVVSRALDAVCEVINKQRKYEPGDPIIVESLRFGDDSKLKPEEEKAKKLVNLAIKEGLTLALENNRAQKTYDWYFNAPQRAKAAESKELRSTYLNFEERVMSLARDADDYGAKIQPLIAAVDNGQATIDQLYDAVKQAKTACGRVVTDSYDRIRAFEDQMPEDLWDACREVETKIGDCFGFKKSAYDELLDWLDERKPSQVSEYKKLMGYAGKEFAQVLKAFDVARKQVGLPSFIELMFSRDFKAWLKCRDAESALYREANAKFGMHPHLALDAGEVLKIEKTTLVVPSLGPGRYETGFSGSSLISQGVRVTPGSTVKIEKRIVDSKGATRFYRVSQFGQGRRQGYINAIALMWYDTPDRSRAHSERAEAWRAPKLKEIRDKLFKAEGLDYDKVQEKAIEQCWGQSWVNIGQPE